MTVREMRPEDIGGVMEIEEASFAVPWTKEGFLSFLLKENTLFLVVEEKGRILGYCGLMTVLDEGDITNIAVSPDRRKEGIGHFLLSSMLLLSGNLGIEMIHLEVREGNSAARSLYKDMGFREDGLRRDYYTDPSEDAVLMSWYRNERQNGM